MQQAAYWFLLFALYSFIGWCYESALCSVTGGKPVNRGFLAGPVCPVYGFGALTVILLLGEVRGLLPLFLAAVLLTTLLEYATSWVLERFFHAKWWDYSAYRFNLHGRVCLLGAVVFGLLSVLVLRVVHPWLAAQVDRLPLLALCLLSGGILLLMAADLAVTVRHLLAMNGRLAEVQAALDAYKAQLSQKVGELRETLEEIREDGLSPKLDELRETLSEQSARYQERLAALREEASRRFEDSEWNTARIKTLATLQSWQDRRILHAFPRMKSTHYSEAFEELRRLHSSRKDDR